MPSDPCEVVVKGVRGEAAGHEGRVVNADYRIEKDLLQPAVEVSFEHLQIVRCKLRSEREIILKKVTSLFRAGTLDRIQRTK